MEVYENPINNFTLDECMQYINGGVEMDEKSMELLLARAEYLMSTGETYQPKAIYDSTDLPTDELAAIIAITEGETADPEVLAAALEKVQMKLQNVKISDRNDNNQNGGVPIVNGELTQESTQKSTQKSTQESTQEPAQKSLQTSPPKNNITINCNNVNINVDESPTKKLRVEKPKKEDPYCIIS